VLELGEFVYVGNVGTCCLPLYVVGELEAAAVVERRNRQLITRLTLHLADVMSIKYLARNTNLWRWSKELAAAAAAAV